MRFLLKIIRLSVIMIGLGLGLTYCYAQKCASEYQDYQQENYSSQNGSCPCFSSTNDIKNAIAGYAVVQDCSSNKNYSLLRGGPFTFTSEDYGDAFNCFYFNTETNKKEQIVEYASRDEIINMHMACDYLIRKFAQLNGISCK